MKKHFLALIALTFISALSFGQTRTSGTGTGSPVYATSPTLVTPNLGTPSAGNFSSGSFTWPTLNQNTTGTASDITASSNTSITSLANLVTVGTIGTGTWQGAVIGSTYGGTGINNAGRTLTLNTNSGTLAFSNASKTFTVANTLTLSGTDGSTLNVGAGGTLGSLALLSSIDNSNWSGAVLGTANGGTGVDNSTGGTANQFWARPNGATGAATYRAIVAADIPTLNQNTTGSAATLTTPRTIFGQSFNGSANISDATIGAATGTSLVLSSFLNEAKGADIASATTTDIGAATGNYIDVTGTTAITGLGTVQAGTRRIVRFTGALTLTHNATSLILPGGVNITTVAGDVGVFISLGSGNWRCITYTPVTITGTGSDVRATSPTLVTPNIGVATATSLNGNTFTAGTYTLTGVAAKTLTFNNSVTIAGTDATTLTFPATNSTISRDDGAGTMVAATAAIANTETKIMSSDASMPANRLVAGSAFRITLHGTATSTAAGAGTIRIRYGTNGTTADGILQAFTLAAAATSGTAVPFTIDIILTIRTTGGSATSDGGLTLVNNGTTGLSTTATSVIRGTATTINTATAATFLTVTYISGNANTACTFQEAVITVLNK